MGPKYVLFVDQLIHFGPYFQLTREPIIFFTHSTNKKVYKDTPNIFFIIKIKLKRDPKINLRDISALAKFIYPKHKIKISIKLYIKCNFYFCKFIYIFHQIFNENDKNVIKLFN